MCPAGLYTRGMTAPTVAPNRSETPLARALHELPATGRRTPRNAFELARRWFLDGRRIDMQQLAAELGIGRATLYRWCGSRELLLGEVIWSLNAQALARTGARTRGAGRGRIVRILERTLSQVRSFEPLQRFVADDPEYALRVLTSKHSVVQGRLIDWCAERLEADVQLADTVDARDLAYVIVRVCESFVWSDMITGAPPEIGKAARMVDLLVSAAERPDARAPRAPAPPAPRAPAPATPDPPRR
jgi:AcrR family transcriptional regulator